MYKSKSFSIRKMATTTTTITTGGWKTRILFACASLRGCLWLASRTFYGKLTAGGTRFSDSYLTWKTLRDTRWTPCFQCIFYFFPHISVNSFDMYFRHFSEKNKFKQTIQPNSGIKHVLKITDRFTLKLINLV